MPLCCGLMYSCRASDEVKDGFFFYKHRSCYERINVRAQVSFKYLLISSTIVSVYLSSQT